MSWWKKVWRPLRWLDDLARDARLGFRALRRERLFTVSVTIILTLGIGTSVTMFSVLNAVVLRPLPYDRPGELAMLTTHLIAQNQPDGTSPPNLFDWRQSASFAAMTFFRRTSVSKVTFAGADAPQRAQEGLVGPEFFELLGTAPLVGRTFSNEEFERRDRVVVLSEGLWQEQFGRSPTARSVRSSRSTARTTS
jgi:putative ABC transport system permease protein